MSSPVHPRRPAMLEPADAEQIRGDSDPALRSEAASATAHALLSGLPLTREDAEDASELLDDAGEGGLDAIAELWSRSPATTAPGALWRLFLVREWWSSDPAQFESAAGVAGVDAGVLRRQLETLFTGGGTQAFPALLDASARLVRQLSRAHSDAPRLAALADELAAAAGLAGAGRLE